MPVSSENEPPQKGSFKMNKQVKFWHGVLVVLIVSVVLSAIILNVSSSVYNPKGFEQIVVVSAAKDDNRDEELVKIKDAIKTKGAKWEAGDNEIFRLSDEERKKRANLSPEDTFQAAATYQATATATPSTMDWRNNYGNFVTPIRNQGSCGSCWAFAATAGDESQNLIEQNTPSIDLNLAEQILVSCSGAGSCSGGSPYSASTYIKNTGLPLENCYPYTATNGVCSNACSNWQLSTYKIGSIISVQKAVADMEQAINIYGPIITTFSVYSDFYAYRSGVYSYTSGTYVGGHAVLIVGYDDVGQYFIVKNSWGTGWGEAGFFRIAFSQLSNIINFGVGSYAYSSIAPTLSSVTVTSPNGGESWDAGSLTNRAISWNFLGDSNALVKIELMKGGLLNSTINSSVSVGNKSYNWNIPADQAPGNDYQIKITSTGNGISDISNSNFSITAPVQASLTLAYPVGGETFNPRNNLAIRWNFTGNPGISLKIDLLQGGIYVKNIVTGVNTGSGSYTWKIPSNQAAGTNYQIKITSNTNSAYTSVSNGYFTINAGPKGKK